jgi:tetratricopeptide (TPR) repeat protein
MLETIRAYAAERLAAAPDHDAIHERHAAHHLELARRHGSDRALWGPDRREHLAELDAESENLQLALRWAIERADAESALGLCSALGRYWLLRGLYADAMAWIERALRLPGAHAHPALRVDVMLRKTWALFPLGRADERLELLEEAEAVARELGDPRALSQVLQTRSVAITEAEGPHDVADALADEALHWATAAGDEWAAAMAAVAGARSATSGAALRERVAGAAARLEAVGSAYILAYLLSFAAYKSLLLSDDADAREFVRRATAAAAELGDPALAMQLHGEVGLVELLAGDADTARRAFIDEATLCRDLVYLPFALECLSGLAAVAVLDGDLDRAARLRGAASAHRYEQRDDAIQARLQATFFAPARERYGAGVWDAAEREGAALGFEPAIAYALGAGVSGPGPSTGGRRAPAR